GRAEDLVTAEEFEADFQWLYDFSQRAPFDVRTTAAEHYRRVVLQRRAAERRTRPPASVPQTAAPPSRRGLCFTTQSGTEQPDGIRRAPKGVNDGNGFVFIAHNGDVYPSGFLPIVAGNVRHESLAQIYRYSPIFQQLRNSDSFKGKCGYCEFRYVCGG